MKKPLKLPSPRNRHAEAELRGFFANSLGLICIAGFDGRFKRLNPAWKNTLGWTLKELKAGPFLDFVHPDDRLATLAELDGLTRRRRTISFENRCLCKDGSYRWLQWQANSPRARGQIYAIARDITLRRRLEDETLEATDREKERLGRELHDGLCQNLAGIAALSSALSRRLRSESREAAGEAAEITRLLNETIGYARDMARGLNPVGLEEIGLAAALQTLASNVAALFPASCKFRCNRPSVRVGPEVETQLYRIAQEAVSNAISHGRGKRIEVRLRFQKRRGLLSVRDYGLGISKKALASEGIGLHTMAYRSRLIGASLQVKRLPRRGTEVACAFPLPSDRKEDS